MCCFLLVVVVVLVSLPLFGGNIYTLLSSSEMLEAISTLRKRIGEKERTRREKQRGEKGATIFKI